MTLLLSSPARTCDARLAGETMLLDRTARQTHLFDDLVEAFGVLSARAMLSLAIFFITSSRSAAYLYPNWRNKHVAPLAPSLSPKEIGELFASLGEQKGSLRKFFKARIARLDKDEVFSFDATNIATEAARIEEAQDGKGKKAVIRRQVSMALLFGHKSSLPVAFRMLPGNITDVTGIPDLLDRFDDLGVSRVSATVPDRGYFSREILERFIRDGRKVIMAAKTNVEWISKAIDQAMPQLSMIDNYVARCIHGYRVPVDFTVGSDTRKIFVHVFRDEQRRPLDEAAPPDAPVCSASVSSSFS